MDDAVSSVLGWIGPLMMMGGFLIGLIASGAALVKKPLAGGMATAGFLGLIVSSGFDIVFWRYLIPYSWSVPWWFYDAYGLGITLVQDAFAATVFLAVAVACVGSTAGEVAVDA